MELPLELVPARLTQSTGLVLRPGGRTPATYYAQLVHVLYVFYGSASGLCSLDPVRRCFSCARGATSWICPQTNL